MKKIHLILSITVSITGLFLQTSAQRTVSVFNKNTVKQLYNADSLNMLFSEDRKNDIRLKAVRDFMKFYNDIDDVEWYTVPDGFIARFQQNGIETKVTYDIAGRRSNILRTYDALSMKAEIRDIVKSQYYDYDILVAYEVEHNNGLIYIVKIWDKTKLKVIQIVNDEVKVLEDYVRG